MGSITKAEEIRAGNQQGQDCAEACVHLKKAEDTINGVKVYSDTSKKGCWCGKKMYTIETTDKRYKTCFLIPKEIGSFYSLFSRFQNRYGRLNAYPMIKFNLHLSFR